MITLIKPDGRKNINRCRLCGEILQNKKRQYCKEHNLKSLWQKHNNRYDRAVEQKKLTPNQNELIKQFQMIVFNMCFDLNKLGKLDEKVKDAKPEERIVLNSQLNELLGTISKVVSELKFINGEKK